MGNAVAFAGHDMTSASLRNNDTSNKIPLVPRPFHATHMTTWNHIHCVRIFYVLSALSEYISVDITLDDIGEPLNIRSQYQ